MSFPPCFTSESYARFRHAAIESVRLDEPVPNFCFDCTAHHQQAMLEEDRCIYPNTDFIVVFEEDHPFLNKVAPPESYTVGIRL